MIQQTSKQVLTYISMIGAEAIVMAMAIQNEVGCAAATVQVVVIWQSGHQITNVNTSAIMKVSNLIVYEQ